MRKVIALVIVAMFLFSFNQINAQQVQPDQKVTGNWVKVNDQVVTLVFTNDKGETVTAQAFTVQQLQEASQQLDIKYKADKAELTKALTILETKK